MVVGIAAWHRSDPLAQRLDRGEIDIAHDLVKREVLLVIDRLALLVEQGTWLMPTSTTTTAPGLTMSAVTRRGRPTALTQCPLAAERSEVPAVAVGRTSVAPSPRAA